MPSGIAVRLAPTLNTTPKDSVLFRVYPSLGMYDDDRSHVAVRFGRGVDHGLLETSVFYADEDGRCADLGSDELLATTLRIVGRHDVTAALANVCNGYLEVSSDELAPLKEKGTELAKTFATDKLNLEPAHVQEYAELNWGIFASHHLVQTGRFATPVKELNTVDWTAYRDLYKSLASQSRAFA